MLHAEVAAFVFEVLAVLCKQLAEHLAFNLIDKVVDGITVEEAALLGVVRMQVEIECESAVLVKMLRETLNGVYCGVLLSIWLQVVPVEVVAEGIHTEVSSEHPVDVDHGHHHEHKHLSQQIRPQVSLAGEEFQHANHGVAGCRLGWVHSRRY